MSEITVNVTYLNTYVVVWSDSYPRWSADPYCQMVETFWPLLKWRVRRSVAKRKRMPVGLHTVHEASQR